MYDAFLSLLFVAFLVAYFFTQRENEIRRLRYILRRCVKILSENGIEIPSEILEEDLKE